MHDHNRSMLTTLFDYNGTISNGGGQWMRRTYRRFLYPVESTRVRRHRERYVAAPELPPQVSLTQQICAHGAVPSVRADLSRATTAASINAQKHREVNVDDLTEMSFRISVSIKPCRISLSMEPPS